ncbi:DUF3006 domain-containing protein [Tepidibacter formicigenes]|jgi:preprotein translocase subunit YajC|uniref:DUF3006 domain-containing protein n=1 Tax=Tepidibacter formicigenes DSM 15518 TaxID=1123349 RepID=A0A1M6LYC7_9FIRM|nr:DUF3006 domain-containing protein [Tepidibacter formicigenes]SHJ76196.1 Protein of unknown function [Tepidibacter formicigenes DSM 15518]
MKGTIDRFEKDLAVIELEDNTFITIHKSKLPSNAKEGDVLIINKSKIEIDLNKTKKIKEEIENLMDELFED